MDIKTKWMKVQIYQVSLHLNYDKLNHIILISKIKITKMNWVMMR